jgi:hypothetical protein
VENIRTFASQIFTSLGIKYFFKIAFKIISSDANVARFALLK